MATSSTTAYTVLRAAQTPEPLRGHIRDLPSGVLHRILLWKLLANGEWPAVVSFVFAAPFLADQAGGEDGIELLASCGLDETNFCYQQDLEISRKFSMLRRSQDRERCARQVASNN